MTRIINTHTHGDHTGSNELLPRHASSSSRTRTRRPTWRRWTPFQGEKAQFLPKTDLQGQADVRQRQDQIDLYLLRHRATPTATRSWSSLRWGRARRRHVRVEGCPFIDRNNGGSGVELAERCQAPSPNQGRRHRDPGAHGDDQRWPTSRNIQRYNDGLRRRRRQAAMKAGKSGGRSGRRPRSVPRNILPTNPSQQKEAVQAIYDEVKQ